MRKIVQIGLWVMLLGLPLLGEGPLTNDAIIKMVGAGLEEDVIINVIKSQPANYTFGVDDLIALKEASVPDKVVEAMLAKSQAGAAPAVVSEIGVYYKKNGKWEELGAEPVNWKSGGGLMSIASVGLVKGDLIGNLEGGKSRHLMSAPFEILVYAPEGVAITEYQLLRVRSKDDSREFRTVVGGLEGLLHTSSSANRDMIEFEGKKIAPRTYLITLPNLWAGEYGILPPGVEAAARPGARGGKIYTFRLE
jgi:hypothetical protein